MSFLIITPFIVGDHGQHIPYSMIPLFLTHGIELLLGRILVIGISRRFIIEVELRYIQCATTTPPLIGGTIRFGDIQFIRKLCIASDAAKEFSRQEGSGGLLIMSC